jgi:hypothetical protein
MVGLNVALYPIVTFYRPITSSIIILLTTLGEESPIVSHIGNRAPRAAIATLAQAHSDMDTKLFHNSIAQVLLGINSGFEHQ